MAKVDHLRLKFIDETGVNKAMTRLYGRAERGERVTEGVPRNYGKQTSIISAMGLGGPIATMTIEGSVDTLVFNAYVEKVLGPTLEPGDIVVLDNLSAHRASVIEEVVRGKRGEVIWLSPYSPDYSPIEKMWSKMKAILRKVKARSQEELEQAIVAALELVTPNDCLGWFKHCGYQVALNCN